MVFAYNIFIIFYQLGIRLASTIHPKAKAWVRGRKEWRAKISSAVDRNEHKLIWIHSASLGEFEQGRTLIESIKHLHPTYKILVTFFSPSGYEVRKNYAGADYVFYLPMDGKKNAQDFIDLINPSLAIFIKYELWYHYLKNLNNRKIPTILISAIILPSQAYFGLFGKFFRKMLDLFTHIFVQDERSKNLLSSIKIQIPVTVSGDTRFDRVFQLLNESFKHDMIENFCNHGPVLIAGSTWKEDEEALAYVQEQHPSLKLIIAPHEINSSHISTIKSLFKNAVCLSEYSTEESCNVLIIDSIGMLSKIYRYSTIAYVGGGFNKAGIHNILEAAVYGKIVFWGPNYDRAAEASAMIEIGCGYSFDKKERLHKQIKFLLENHKELEDKSQAAATYVKSNTGATSRIMVFLQHSNII